MSKINLMLREGTAKQHKKWSSHMTRMHILHNIQLHWTTNSAGNNYIRQTKIQNNQTEQNSVSLLFSQLYPDEFSMCENPCDFGE